MHFELHELPPFIRIDYDENVRKLKDRLCDEYKLRTGNEIELCCDANPKIHKDRNESYWAIVHEKGDTTQHEGGIFLFKG